MPNVILPNLGIELPDVGSDQDTWGNILNSDLQILDKAVQYDVISKTLAGVDVTLTDVEAASAVINLTGTLTANVNVIVPATPVRVYLVRNQTSGAFTVTVKTAAGTGTPVQQGTSSLVYSDGTNIIQGATSVNGSFSAGNTSVANLAYTGTLTGGTGVVNIGSEQIFKDAAGNVGIGTATPGSRLHTVGPFPNRFTSQNSTQDVGVTYTVAGVTDWSAGVRSNSNFSISNSNNFGGPDVLTLTGAGNAGLVVTPSAVSRLDIEVSANTFLQRGLNAGVAVYQVLANGNVQNTNNSYGAISDAKLKENVVDASSYLDRFMQVRFRNFNFIGSDLKQFGVIAQELETVFPGLVDESPDMEQVAKTRTVEVPAVEEVLDEEGNVVTPAQPATTREEEYTESVPTGTATKSVKYSVLALMAGKVIQEQQAIINRQQTQIDSILSRLLALESK